MITKWSLQHNTEQRRAFTIVVEHMLWNDPEQMLMFLMGLRGSSKSHVIQVIVDAFEQLGRSHEILLSMPTGSAACLINRYTIHALMLMNTHSLMKERKWQNNDDIWRDVTYLVLDEVSMVLAEMLSDIAN
ncbi:hypothetical protein M404DRAFT_151723 [Pisolithus tinctorius Marx 270]|uniref:Uncharacterized protein n=1 Tax=Pisolithus tinctorius Marx 270 TaxID=870435 RepID=A0A0C3IVE2_PISTI|nr:hypothetical protein M404DRAFT_151723 [Pisolithus tinctorius Marx 270]